MLDQPQIVETDARDTAVIRLTVSREQIGDVMGPAFAEVMDALITQGIEPTGPFFSHHFRMDPEVFDLEVGVPVATPVAETGRVEPGELPAATVARTVYHGPYDQLGSAWGEFSAWFETHGHAPAPDLWECYVSGPETNPDPATWQTELNRPLVGRPR